MEKKMHKKSQTRTEPWKKPRNLVWFFCSLVFASWLTINMPEGSMRSSANKELQSTTNLVESGNSKSTIKTSELSQKKEDIKSAASQKKSQKTDTEKLLVKAKYFVRLFLLVGIAAFLGGIIEARHWHMVLAKLMGKLTNAARLPEIVGLAMPTALFSNAAANSILVNCHADGQIRTSALIAGGMANSYLAFVSHSLRVMYPVVAAIGIPGILYFTIQFSAGLFVIFCVLLWNRWRIDHINKEMDSQKIIHISTDFIKKDPAPWTKAIKLALTRTFALIFRMICITVPLMIGVEWLLKEGVFDFWEKAVPLQISHFFKAEMISIVLAQMGGLIQSSAISANLRAEGIINNAQILLAMLVASTVGNPFRMLRRNLPSALALFPPRIACIIVFGMQISRFITTVLASIGVILFIHYSTNSL